MDVDVKVNLMLGMFQTAQIDVKVNLMLDYIICKNNAGYVPDSTKHNILYARV